MFIHISVRDEAGDEDEEKVIEETEKWRRRQKT